MSAQIDNRAPIGSLLKQPRHLKPKRERRSARVEDAGYLALIRQLPCLSCGQDPAGVAAHVRMSSSAHGKSNPGMRVKPDDKWTLPLCNDCHTEQHREGELSFWYRVGLNPVLVCVKLQQVTPELNAMRAVIMSIGHDKNAADGGNR